MLTYNPVVKNGLWEVRYGDITKKYRAIDRAEAVYKMIGHIEATTGNSPDVSSPHNLRPYLVNPIEVSNIEPTIRKNGPSLR